DRPVVRAQLAWVRADRRDLYVLCERWGSSKQEGEYCAGDPHVVHSREASCWAGGHRASRTPAERLSGAADIAGDGERVAFCRERRTSNLWSPVRPSRIPRTWPLHRCSLGDAAITTFVASKRGRASAPRLLVPQSFVQPAHLEARLPPLRP